MHKWCSLNIETDINKVSVQHREASGQGNRQRTESSRCPAQNLNKSTSVRVSARWGWGRAEESKSEVEASGQFSAGRTPGIAASVTCGPPRKQQVSTLPQAYPQFPAAPLGPLQVPGLKFNPTLGRRGAGLRRGGAGGRAAAGRGGWAYKALPAPGAMLLSGAGAAWAGGRPVLVSAGPWAFEGGGYWEESVPRLPRLFARERRVPANSRQVSEAAASGDGVGGRRALLLPAQRCVPRGTSALSFANFDLVLGRDCSWRLCSRGFGNLSCGGRYLPFGNWLPPLVRSWDAGRFRSLCTSCLLLQIRPSSFLFPAPRKGRSAPARETEPLTMVATGSLSSKNPACISELLDHGFHRESLLNGERLSCPPLSPPKVAAPG